MMKDEDELTNRYLLKTVFLMWLGFSTTVYVFGNIGTFFFPIEGLDFSVGFSLALGFVLMVMPYGARA